MIEIGKRYGCLTVLDKGEEYCSTERYREAQLEYDKLVEEISPLLSEKEIIDKKLRCYPYYEMNDGTVEKDNQYYGIDYLIKKFSNRVHSNRDYERL